MEKQYKRQKYFYLISFLLIFSLIGLFVFLVVSSLNNTTRIILNENSQFCISSEYCYLLDSTYSNGYVIWEVQKGWPLNLTISTSSVFNKDQPLRIACPIEYKNGENEFLAKIKFFTVKPDANKCRISKE